jgi:hypothetical protein
MALTHEIERARLAAKDIRWNVIYTVTTRPAPRRIGRMTYSMRVDAVDKREAATEFYRQFDAMIADRGIKNAEVVIDSIERWGMVRG